MNSKKSVLILSLGTALGYFIFCIGWLSAQYNFDGIVWSTQLELRKAGIGFGILFNPLHILYVPTGYFFWRALLVLGLDVRAVLGLQLFNLVLSSINLAIFCRNLVRMDPQKKWLAPLIALASGFTYAYWYLSVEPEVYVFAVLILNLLFSLLLAAASAIKEKRLDPRRAELMAAALGLMVALSTLGHIAYSLIVFPAIYILYRMEGTGNIRAAVFRCLIFSAVIASVLVPAYLLAFHYLPPQVKPGGAFPGSFFNWVFAMASTHTAQGFSESFWALNASAPGKWVLGMGSSLFAARPIIERGRAGTGFEILVMAAIAGLALSYFFAWLKNIRKGNFTGDLIMCWFLPGAAFTAVWEPHNYEHKMFILPCIWMMVFLALPAPAAIFKKYLSASVAVLIAGGLLAANFHYSFRPGADPENNFNLRFARKIGELTEPSATIIISGADSGFWMGKEYLPYFAGRKIMILDVELGEPLTKDLLLKNVRDRIDSDLGSGRQVYLLSEIFESKVKSGLARTHFLSPADLDQLWGNYRVISEKPIIVNQGERGRLKQIVRR